MKKIDKTPFNIDYFIKSIINSKIHNDDTISVVPRIIDPNMKFTKESLDMIESKKNKNIEFNILENNISKNQTTESEKIIENPTISVGFFSKYKYYILIIIIIILINEYLRIYNTKNWFINLYIITI